MFIVEGFISCKLSELILIGAMVGFTCGRIRNKHLGKLGGPHKNEISSKEFRLSEDI